MPNYGHIRARCWLDLIERLNIMAPYELNVLDDGESAENWLEEVLPVENVQSVLSLPSKDRSFIADSIYLFVKARHVNNRVCSALKYGRSTWALVDAHHASLLFAKSICGFMGVHVYSIGGKSYLIDFFPEVGNRQQVKEFRKTHSLIASPVRVMKCAGLFEQRDVWELLSRFIEVGSLGDVRDGLLEKIRSQDLGAHKPLRNQIFYGLRSWTFQNDLHYASSPLGLFTDLQNGQFRFDGPIRELSILQILQSLAASMLRDLVVKYSISDPDNAELLADPPNCLSCFEGVDTHVCE